MLQITSVCNAGIYLEYEGFGLLIDGVAESCEGFFGTPEGQFREMLQRQGRFRNLRAVLFTHDHPDHYDAGRTAQLLASEPKPAFFLPTEALPEKTCNEYGPFRVYSFRAEHMPQRYAETALCTLLILVGDRCIYVASDALLDPALHERLLSGLRPDTVIVNPVYLSYEPTKIWLKSLDLEKIIVYHIPADPNDPTGIRRKSERTLQRCAKDFPGLSAALSYPTVH